MTSFIKIINAESQVRVGKKWTEKAYFNLSEYHWQRIRNANLMLSDLKIGPQIRTIDNIYHIITMRTVIVLDDDLVDEHCDEIKAVLDILHGRGYGHGDMNPSKYRN